MPTESNIIFKFTPRSYQRRVLEALASGIKRVALVWHRRAGKDLTLYNWIAVAALKRVGTYFYFFPTYAQGKKILWDSMDADGKRILDYIPPELVESRNETEMQQKLTNGSVIQIIGTDKIDSIVGTNCIGCVFSEFALQDPKAWSYVQPILAENGGWAAFAYTPRGRNHGYRLYEYAKAHPEIWYSELLTIRDTVRDDGSPVVPEGEIEQARSSGIDEDIIQQEFYCSFDGSLQGNYYGKQIQTARQEGRIVSLPYNPNRPVYTAWDLGLNDTNAIWFFQRNGQWRDIIDYHENRGVGLPDYAKVLKEKPYVFGRHFLPHDINVKEYGTGRKREDAFRELIGSNYTIVPKLKVQEGIDAVRRVLPMCRFDSRKCDSPVYKGHSGIDSLNSYHKEYDDIAQCFAEKPVHDWASNGADAFRQLALADRDETTKTNHQTRADTAYHPFQDVQADNEWEPFGRQPHLV